MWHLLKDMRKKDKGLAFLAVLLIAGQVFLDLKLLYKRNHRSDQF